MSGVLSAHSVLLFSAFWTAVWRYTGSDATRMIAGLGAGAVFAHVGWLAAHGADLAGEEVRLLWYPSGFSVLLFPLGPWLFCRDPAAWRTLPLALAVARLGCVAAACCGGREEQWGTHPTPLYEICLMVALDRTLARVEPRWTRAVFLMGFGASRLVVQPFRAETTLASPWLSPEWLALAWLTMGAVSATSRQAVSERGRRAEASCRDR